MKLDGLVVCGRGRVPQTGKKKLQELAEELGQQGSSRGGDRTANSEAGRSENPGEEASGLLS